MSIFSDRLKYLRKINGNNIQESVAGDLGISRSMLSNYERGTREPDFDMLSKIADYYNVSADYLIGRTEHVRVNSDDYPAEQDAVWNNSIILSQKSRLDLLEYIELLKLRDEKENNK